MAKFTQDNRRIGISTPLGDGKLLLQRLAGQEEMSRLFSYQLDLLSDDDAIDAKKIVGKPVTFWVDYEDGGEKRFFHGFVRRFAYQGKGDRLSMYRAEVVPWLWFLTRTTDCRIFQNKSIPDIIKAIFGDLGFTDFEFADVKEKHEPWDYCVQYRETDFNFVSRLMEEEGIFYYFKHEEKKHTLVLCDQKSAYKDCRDKEVEMLAKDSFSRGDDRIFQWEHQYEFRSGRFTHTDYNFETPTTALETSTRSALKFDGIAKFDRYDFPGGYEKKGEGETWAKIRMEEDEASAEVVNGRSYCRSFNPGGKFKMKKHSSSAEQGKSYVLTNVQHLAEESTSYAPGVDQSDWRYENSFDCIPDSVPFRTQRIAPKPLINSVQTAVVVGPAGEEIFVDKYGRVKVQFYWDREGKKDDKTTCWIRVSQDWAGQGWGAMHIPHIGQEVVVAFLEGDPDRPLIIGRVYNANQTVPLPLPADKTCSIVRDYGDNEFVWEGKDGSQCMHMNQKCGNEFLLDGSKGQESVEIRDKYGNEIVMDAVKGTIRIFSPTHESEIVLGRSIELFSLSDWKINFRGSEHKVIDAAKHENIAGISSKIIGGLKHETVIGVEAKFNAILKAEALVGGSIKIAKARQFERKPKEVEKVGDVLKVWKKLVEKTENGKKIFTTTQEHSKKSEVHSKKRKAFSSKWSVAAAKAMLAVHLVVQGPKAEIKAETNIASNSLVVSSGGAPPPPPPPPPQVPAPPAESETKKKKRQARNKRKAARKKNKKK